MGDIPDDIMKAAEEAWRKADDKIIKLDAIAEIAKAILAERQKWSREFQAAFDAKWQTINAAPDEGTTVIAYGTAKNGGFFTDAMFSKGEWLLFSPERDEYCFDFEPSHWMHYPAPPITEPSDALPPLSS